MSSATQAEADYELDTDFCPHGWWGSHKFEPRYDLGPADFTPFETFKGSAHTMEKLRTKTYVRDVCTKCGKTIERETAK